MKNLPERLELSAFGRFPPSWLHLLEALLALQPVEPFQLLHSLAGARSSCTKLVAVDLQGSISAHFWSEVGAELLADFQHLGGMPQSAGACYTHIGLLDQERGLACPV